MNSYCLLFFIFCFFSYVSPVDAVAIEGEPIDIFGEDKERPDKDIPDRDRTDIGSSRRETEKKEDIRKKDKKSRLLAEDRAYFPLKYNDLTEGF